jgi:hypothetical protein
MKSKTEKSGPVVALLSILALAGALFLAPAQGVGAKSPDAAGKARAQARKLEGTWRVQVTIRDCQTGAEVRTAPSVITFAQGGTLTDTAAGPSPALRGPGHGVWRHTGGRTYSMVLEAFTFDPSGAWTGTVRVAHTLEIGDSPDELTSSGTNEIRDADGNLLATGCSTAVAQRLE